MLLHVVKSEHIVPTLSNTPTSPAPDTGNYIGAKGEFRHGRVALSSLMATIALGSSLLARVLTAFTKVGIEGVVMNGREIAEAISEGINVLASLLEAEKSGARVPEGSLEALDAMARAYADVRAGVVVTNDVPTIDDVEMVWRVRTIVSEWSTTGQRSADLVPCVKAILDRMGVHVDGAD